jgi:hypothetical protein
MNLVARPILIAPPLCTLFPPPPPKPRTRRRPRRPPARCCRRRPRLGEPARRRRRAGGGGGRVQQAASVGTAWNGARPPRSSGRRAGLRPWRNAPCAARTTGGSKEAPEQEPAPGDAAKTSHARTPRSTPRLQELTVYVSTHAHAHARARAHAHTHTHSRSHSLTHTCTHTHTNTHKSHTHVRPKVNRACRNWR